MQFTQSTIVAILATLSTAFAGKVARPNKVTAGQAQPSGFYSPSNPAHAPPYEDPYNGTDTWVTKTVTNFVTYCPEPTQIVTKGQTYTVTESKWATITYCPEEGCTISYHTVQPSVVPGTVAPSYTPTYAVPYPSSNGTYSKPSATGAAQPSGSNHNGSNTPLEVGGAADVVGASTGALIVAAAAAAYFL